jgi:hypothetical protein
MAPLSAHVLSHFGYLAPRLHKARGEACAHVIDVGFDGKKQLRVLHWNAEIVYRRSPTV